MLSDWPDLLFIYYYSLSRWLFTLPENVCFPPQTNKIAAVKAAITDILKPAVKIVRFAGKAEQVSVSHSIIIMLQIS